VSHASDVSWRRPCLRVERERDSESICVEPSLRKARSVEVSSESVRLPDRDKGVSKVASRARIFFAYAR
jgi:hypothetical protein